MTRADLESVGRPRRVGGDLFTLAVGSVEGEKVQFACIVSKKIALRANVRNLIKRRAKAAFLKAKDTLSPGSYVFTAKKPAKEATYADIAGEIGLLMRRSSR